MERSVAPPHWSRISSFGQPSDGCRFRHLNKLEMSILPRVIYFSIIVDPGGIDRWIY